MKNTHSVIAFALLLTSASASAAPSEPKQVEKLAMDFLMAIKQQDAMAIRRIARNDAVFDDLAVDYLIATHDPFPKSPARSAFQLLQGRVLTKVVPDVSTNGVKRVDVIYLPSSTAKDFNQLSKLIKANKAKNFVNYLICSFDIDEDGARLTDACGAESDLDW